MAVAAASSIGMVGDLLFGIGLPRGLASAALLLAMLLVGGLAFAAQREVAHETIDNPPPIDQLIPEPVLVGRTELAHALYKALEDVAPAHGFIDTADSAHGRASVVLVHGAAGTGKTTLALHAAHHVKAAFPDARLYIDLRGEDAVPITSGQALEHFLRSLGVAPADIPRTVGDRAAMFRSLTGRLRMLVLLDNAHSTEQIRPLIPAGPGCAVVITSRRALSIGHIGRRQMVRVSLPEEDEALAVLSHYAGQARVLEDPAAALEIVHFCGRLPIALKIVGSRLYSRPDLTVGQMRERLEDEKSRIRELSYEDESLQACLLLTHRDLSEAAQRLLSGLSAMPAGRLTAWHVEQVGDRDQVMSGVVDELIESRMMEARRTAGSSYRLHDLIRVFGSEQYKLLPPEERHRMLRQAVVGYRQAALRLAAVRAPELVAGESVRPSRTMDGLPAAEWFSAEIDRLVWAHARAPEVGIPEAATLIAECVSYFLDDIGANHEGSADLFAAEMSGNDAAAFLRSAAACSRARASLLLANHDYAGAMAQLDACPSGHDRHADARRTALVACIEREQGRYDAAAEHMSTAVDGMRALGDSWHLALALETLGEIRRAQGKPSEGEACQREALRIAEDFGDLRTQARLRRTLAETLAYKREFAEARQLLAASLAGFRRLGDRLWEARTLYALGRVQRLLGERTEALDSYDRALRFFEQFGDKLWVGRVHNARIRVLAGLGDLDRAHAETLKALAVFEEVGHKVWHANTLRDLGWLSLRSGRPDDAISPLRSAVETSQSAGDAYAEAMARHLLGVAYRETGLWAEARRELEAAREIYLRGGYGWNDAACAQDLVIALRTGGDAGEAERFGRTVRAANPLFAAMSTRNGAVAVPDED